MTQISVEKKLLLEIDASLTFAADAMDIMGRKTSRGFIKS
jgi:hypothetical protein